jgi:hypothetical protein
LWVLPTFETRFQSARTRSTARRFCTKNAVQRGGVRETIPRRLRFFPFRAAHSIKTQLLDSFEERKIETLEHEEYVALGAAINAVWPETYIVAIWYDRAAEKAV